MRIRFLTNLFHRVLGEAEYVADIHVRPDELYASFVTSDRGPGKIISIDASEALVSLYFDLFV